MEPGIIGVPRNLCILQFAFSQFYYNIFLHKGGVGQQNAKVKVTFESASSSDEIKSLRRTGSCSETDGSRSDNLKSPVTPYKPPRAAPRNRVSRSVLVFLPVSLALYVYLSVSQSLFLFSYLSPHAGFNLVAIFAYSQTVLTIACLRLQMIK